MQEQKSDPVALFFQEGSVRRSLYQSDSPLIIETLMALELEQELARAPPRDV